MFSRRLSGLLEAGFPVDMDSASWIVSRAELDRQNAELDVNEARLTAHVKTLIDEDPFSPEAIETTCSIEPRAVAYELHEAMEIAREQRFRTQIDQQVVAPRNNGRPGVSPAVCCRLPVRCWARLPVPLGFLAKIRHRFWAQR